MANQTAEVVEIPGLRWDGGSATPVLISTDYRTLFAFRLPTGDDRVVVGEFEQCSSVRFGLPNDEVIAGHPCGKDLMRYGVHVIHHSQWIAELREIESVHPQADDHWIARASHYFLTFHDSSMEAAAWNVAVVGSFMSMADAVAEMVLIADPR